MINPEAWKKWEGRVDGKFPLRQWLGGSNHSAVFLTERPGQPNQKVAIKLIAAGAEADQQLSYWRAAAQLSHPHLMRIYDAGRCRLDGTSLLYLVTEYAEEDLSQILPQRALTPPEVTDMIPPLLDALSYLHGKGFVHGRIKPSNVHATEDQLKLSADEVVPFAESSPARRRRDVYDAPETAAGIVSPAGDVWSIGVMLVAALTQNLSFEDEASRPDPTPPETVPQPFRGIARECLHLDPKRRCSLADIQARLQPAARSVPAEPTAPPAPHRTVRRGPIAAALLVGAILVGAIFFISRGKSGPTPVATTSEQPANQTPPETASSPANAQPATPKAAPPKPTSKAPKTTGAAGGEVVHQVLPEVSQRSRNTITGTVKVGVRVQVDATGKVTEAKLTSPGPSKYFADLALKSAKDWEFSPPEVDGKPVPSAWSLQFRFKRSSIQASPERVTR
jgi:TonB family protein